MLYVGNWSKGKYNGWGLQITITNYKDIDLDEINPDRQIECVIGHFKDGVIEVTETQKKEKLEMALRAEENK